MSGNIKKHNTKRRMTAAVIPAAAVLAVCGIAAGAAANWDSSAIFSQIMREKAEEPIDYTMIEALGMEINETMDFGDFSFTVNSILTDGQIAYVVYEYTDPDTDVLFPDQEIGYVSPVFRFDVYDPETHRSCQSANNGMCYVLTHQNGVRREILEMVANPGETLEGTVIEVTCTGLNVLFGSASDRLYETGTIIDYEPQTLSYSTENLVTETLTGTADLWLTAFNEYESHVNDVTISALSAKLMLDRLTPSDDDLPSSTFGTADSSQRELIAVYADGTELALSGNWDDHVLGYEPGSAGPKGCLLLSFNRPISLDGLTAVRYLGTEIPLA